MTTIKVNHQKSTDQFWEDETGNKTQYARLYKHEKLMEKGAAKLFNTAFKLNAGLTAFKEEVEQVCQEVYEQYMSDKKLEKLGKGKGNFTWFNFDRSIKIEVSISARITFDDLGIQAAKHLLDKFLNENLTPKIEVLKDLIQDAFSTSSGRLDPKRVMILLKYDGKVNDENYTAAMKHIRESIRRPESKTYFRIWAKDSSGEYQNIDLNFSSL